MPLLQAHIATDRAGRYLTQFCKHAAAMGSGRAHRFRMHGGSPAGRSEVRVTAQWTDTTGGVVLDPWGRVDLEAADDRLLILLNAVDDEAAARMQKIIGDDLHRFGRLAVEWHPVASSPEDPA
jgi:hypothetical protein